MFTDQVEIRVRSGKGGDGMVHFRREKYVPRGGPDGGDGGRGGDMVLEVRMSLNTLSSLRKNQQFRAEDGGNGGSAQRTGKDGSDLVIPVPPGTVVHDTKSGQLLGDLTDQGQRLVLCKGGRGGRGNQHFATSRNQAPRTAERGEPGEERSVRLELQLIADIGIVGQPNAGKSTLLAALTRARPKVAAYPFTTLEPNLGVATLDERRRVVLADIPGLIEGAHYGAGLGHDFLRHIQRTRVLIHLLDGLAPDPLADYSQVNNELALSDQKLMLKPQVVALNKIDQAAVRERLPELKRAFAERGIDLHPISALARTHVTDVLRTAARLLDTAPAAVERAPELPVYRPMESQEIEVTREGTHTWRLSGSAIERSAAMTFWQHDGSVRRFQRLMERLGIDAALRKAGVIEGDTVRIGEYELEWRE